VKLNKLQNKDETFDFDRLALQKIKPCYSNEEIIPFRHATKIWGTAFHFSKEQTSTFLKELEKKKLVKILLHKGIKVLE